MVAKQQRCDYRLTMLFFVFKSNWYKILLILFLNFIYTTFHIILLSTFHHHPPPCAMSIFCSDFFCCIKFLVLLIFIYQTCVPSPWTLLLDRLYILSLDQRSTGSSFIRYNIPGMNVSYSWLMSRKTRSYDWLRRANWEAGWLVGRTGSKRSSHRWTDAWRTYYH